ncbi:MAG: hypothetical protein WAS21_17440 [Geminicoccaceae bacterium]
MRLLSRDHQCDDLFLVEQAALVALAGQAGDRRSAGDLAQPDGSRERRPQRIIDAVRVAVAAPRGPHRGGELCLALRSQLADQGIAVMLDQPAGMAREVGLGLGLDAALLMALQQLGHRHACGLGLPDVAVFGDETGEFDLRGAKVACAEAMALGLSSTCIEPTGTPPVAVRALAEEVIPDPEGFASRHTRYSARCCSPIRIFRPDGPRR